MKFSEIVIVLLINLEIWYIVEVLWLNVLDDLNVWSKFFDVIRLYIYDEVICGLIKIMINL